MTDHAGRSAADLGRAIAAGKVDPVELTEAFLSAIADSPHGESIYARVTADRARAEARAAYSRIRAGQRLSPLDGVPISWKDLVDSVGEVTGAGTNILPERAATRDAQALANATALGLICLGKTHLTELAFSGLGYNPVTRTPPNIHDHGLVPGGSSSGAAASVAFGLAAAGMGSDTGGSVRIPAAWNDLVGLKTTAGLIELDGVTPLCPKFDTLGPLCRSVEDAALLLGVMTGGRTGRAGDLSGVSPRGLRLAVLTTSVLEDMDNAPQSAFEAAVARLGAVGATIEEVEVPAVAEALEIAGILFTTEAWGVWKNEISRRGAAMFPPVRQRFEAGSRHSGADYVAAWRSLDRLRRSFLAQTVAFDAVLMPTAPILPPAITWIEADTEYFISRNLLALRNTRVANLVGACALTIPTGVSHCGLMLVSGPMTEMRLLRVGSAVEAALAASG